MLNPATFRYESNPKETLAIPDDVIAEWLENKLSEASRESYGKSLRYFFCDTTGATPTPDSVRWFLALSEQQALGLMLKWRSHMQHTLKLSPKSINARESAVRSFVQHSRKRGLTQLALKDLGSLKAQVYRDVSGIDASAYSKVLQTISRETLAGKRDYALMLLLWTNALRRIEAVRANVRDLELSDRRLAILAKGSGGEKIYVDISTKVCNALQEYLSERKPRSGDEPLFVALDRSSYGKRLQGQSVAKIVKKYCGIAGIHKRMSPHRVRHSSITCALDATNGNVRKVQKLSRHKHLDTLQIYDDARRRDQGEISDLLSELV